MNARFKILIGYFSLSFLYVNAQDNSPVTLEVSYVGDMVGNVHGGIKTGAAYLGMANLQLSFDTENSHLWKGGVFHINAANTHGGSPSARLIGDFQVASNIEAGNHTYFHELWYSQSIYSFQFTVGVQDLNAEFAASEYGSNFINSSFGIHSTIADNLPSPIFPLTALGFTSKWEINDGASLLAAVYDGCPTDFDHNPYNLKWNLDSRDGVLLISEFQKSISVISSLSGIYKLGGYYHNHLIINGLNGPDTAFSKNYGFYFLADQQLFKTSTGGLNSFLQLSVSPKSLNSHYLYLGGGLSYQGLFAKRNNDVLGLAVASAKFDKMAVGSETTIELNYKAVLPRNFFVQPTVQYIINPFGIGVKLNNALACMARFGIEF